MAPCENILVQIVALFGSFPLTTGPPAWTTTHSHPSSGDLQEVVPEFWEPTLMPNSSCSWEVARLGDQNLQQVWACLSCPRIDAKGEDGNHPIDVLTCSYSPRAYNLNRRRRRKHEKHLRPKTGNLVSLKYTDLAISLTNQSFSQVHHEQMQQKHPFVTTLQHLAKAMQPVGSSDLSSSASLS